jgi:hypothetical protein
MPRHRDAALISGQPPESASKASTWKAATAAPSSGSEWDGTRALQMEGIVGWTDQVRAWLRPRRP